MSAPSVSVRSEDIFSLRKNAGWAVGGRRQPWRAPLRAPGEGQVEGGPVVGAGEGFFFLRYTCSL